ncbi:glycoside hydrolase family protein [Flavobacterium segetis]|uniref:hypothetical protein n=1 Tax=Flavobacterium segetis TaxID=271157 RepID=UPI00116080F1|nr:hypothetical protein [Flavobacterium segetis]
MTILFHLRLFYNDYGIHFYETLSSIILSEMSVLDKFAIEDYRFCKVDNDYNFTYTAVSDSEV